MGLIGRQRAAPRRCAARGLAFEKKMALLLVLFLDDAAMLFFARQAGLGGKVSKQHDDHLLQRNDGVCCPCWPWRG